MSQCLNSFTSSPFNKLVYSLQVYFIQIFFIGFLLVGCFFVFLEIIIYLFARVLYFYECQHASSGTYCVRAYARKCSCVRHRERAGKHTCSVRACVRSSISSTICARVRHTIFLTRFLIRIMPAHVFFIAMM